MSEPTELWAFDLLSLLHTHPGLFDRGVMLGIPIVVSNEILVGLADSIPPWERAYGLSPATQDILLDTLGYYQDDYRENRDPFEVDDMAIQCDYEQGMVEVAFQLSQKIPPNSNYVEWTHHPHPSVLYVVVHYEGR